MKKLKKTLMIMLSLLMICEIKVVAHGGNITGWKDKNSSEIIEHDGKYYGYHNQDGTKHYHQVEWNEEKQRWEITKTAVYYDENFNITNTINDIKQEKIEVKYVESVDGYTAKFELNGEKITVRFLGIDTPETVHPTKGEEFYGKEASNFTKEILENAKKIEIEYDSNASEKDKYERHLAWIWVDGILLQEKLIKNGLATTYMLQYNYKYAWILQEQEEKVKEEKIGIWSDKVENNNGEQENIDNQVNEKEENKQNIYYIFIGITVIILGLVAVILEKYSKKKK
ncbi:MAG: thermonuclease family protein [Clostridia bacterium]|nr:thermonuclease family protein [Clostridia bacterium]